jgi:hypothetical protein
MPDYNDDDEGYVEPLTLPEQPEPVGDPVEVDPPADIIESIAHPMETIEAPPDPLEPSSIENPSATPEPVGDPVEVDPPADIIESIAHPVEVDPPEDMPEPERPQSTTAERIEAARQRFDETPTGVARKAIAAHRAELAKQLPQRSVSRGMSPGTPDEVVVAETTDETVPPTGEHEVEVAPPTTTSGPVPSNLPSSGSNGPDIAEILGRIADGIDRMNERADRIEALIDSIVESGVEVRL